VTAFSLFIALGCALGLIQVYRSAPASQADQRLNLAALLLFTGLIGARLGYVVLNWGYFRIHPGEIPQVWLGGLSWWGALAFALLALAILSRGLREPFGTLTGTLAPLLPPLAVTVWVGCQASGCAYGTLAPETAWWSIDAANELGEIEPRFPLALVAALTLLLAFALLSRWLARISTVPTGRVAALYGLLFGSHTLLFSLWIAEPAPIRWLGLRPGTLAAAALILLCMLALLAERLNPQHLRTPKQMYN